jgi:NTP pyrophosphatase (non-canonical NTP hydrolase)
MNITEQDLVLINKVSEIIDRTELQVMSTPFLEIIEILVKKLETEKKKVKVNQYQDWTARTAPHFDDIVEEMVAWSMGIAGEAGEYCDIVKKEVWHNHPVDNDKKVKELGDIMYYVARSASVLGYTLEEVCLINQAKLKDRYPNGFEAEKSVNREE